MNIKSAQAQLYQSIWRKALNDGEVKITFPSAKDAARVRFALYTAVKGVKSGIYTDTSLMEAITSCSIYIDGNVLTIWRQDKNPVLVALAEQFGVSLKPSDPLKTLDEESLQGSLDKTKALLATSTPSESRSNPYYSRSPASTMKHEVQI